MRTSISIHARTICGRPDDALYLRAPPLQTVATGYRAALVMCPNQRRQVAGGRSHCSLNYYPALLLYMYKV